MMRFNGYSEAKMISGWFYNNASKTRQAMFRRAFGFSHDTKTILRFSRDDKGGKIGDPKDYQESLTEVRVWASDILDYYANRVGASKSQVVHAFVTGEKGSLAKAINKQQEAAHAEGLKIKARLNGDAALKYKLPEILDHDVLLKKIEDTWMAAMGLMTDYEREREGRNASITKQREENAASGTSAPSKPGIKAAIQKVNKKQHVRQAATVGA